MNSGIVIINKEQGMTSQNVVSRVKRILNVKKAGHIGTLDPLATGVLPILIGDATKLSKYLIEHDKQYRTSLFKTNPGYVILSAKIVLKNGDKNKIRELILDRLKRRKESQPLEYPSAGSVFRNPTGLYAGKLIEDINMKGYILGGAQVSLKHANFIVNIGNAKGTDIVKLITLIKEKVKEKYNVDLVLEQEIVK